MTKVRSKSEVGADCELGGLRDVKLVISNAHEDLSV